MLAARSFFRITVYWDYRIKNYNYHGGYLIVITNYGKSRISLIIGGSSVPLVSYYAIGSGSGVALATQTTLLAEEDRQAFTSVSFPENRKVRFTGDWNSIEMSGLELDEWGVQSSGGTLTGSLWSRTSVPRVVFDGTNELRTEETWEVF